MTRRYSKLEIVNQSKVLAGLPTIAQTSNQDQLDYDHERIDILTNTDFSFARKELDINISGLDEDGFFILPKDFLGAVNPPLADRIGNKANLEGGDSTLRYTSDIEDTEIFDPAFTDILIHGLALRFARIEYQTERISMLEPTRERLLQRTKLRESSNQVLTVIR